MSNQVFSNGTIKYAEQIVTFTFTGFIEPSHTPISFPIRFKNNNSVVTIETTLEFQLACGVGDRFIVLDWPNVSYPVEFRPTPRKSVWMIMNMGGVFAKQFSKWTFQPDGNIIITAINSSYPDNPTLAVQPPFGVTVIGTTQNMLSYNIN